MSTAVKTAKPKSAAKKKSKSPSAGVRVEHKPGRKSSFDEIELKMSIYGALTSGKQPGDMKPAISNHHATKLWKLDVPLVDRVAVAKKKDQKGAPSKVWAITAAGQKDYAKLKAAGAKRTAERAPSKPKSKAKSKPAETPATAAATPDTEKALEPTS